jgi:hypothetical protein
MTNIINEQQQANKTLINEIELLKKQLAENKENFKLRTWNAVHSLTESSEYTGTSLRTLERFTWPNNGWVSYPEKNGIEIGRVVFSDEFTPENIVKSFGHEALNYEEVFGFTYQEKEELKEKNALLEKKVVELQQTNQELEEALELEEETSECHLEALEVARQWRIRQSKEKDDNLEKALRKIELLENNVAWQNYLADKQLQELPVLPRRENKFKLLTNKVKNKVSQVKEITKEKFNAYILQKNK